MLHQRLTLDGITLLQDLAADVYNIIASKPSPIYEERVRAVEYTGDYTFGSLQSPKEPIAMATREGKVTMQNFPIFVIGSSNRCSLPMH